MKNIKLLAALFLCLCASQNFGFAQRSISNIPIRDFIKKISEEFYTFLAKKTIKSTNQQESENSSHKTPVTKCGCTQDELKKKGYEVDLACKEPKNRPTITTHEEPVPANCNASNPDYALSPTSRRNSITKFRLGLVLK